MRKMETRGTTIGKLAATAAVIAALGAGSVNADDWEFKLIGVAEEICNLPSGGIFDADLDRDVRLVGDDGKVNTTTRILLQTATTYCNHSVNVILTSANGSLLNGSSTALLPNGVANRINYQAKVTWGQGYFLTLNASGTVEVSKDGSLGPTNAPVKLEMTPIASQADVLLAGTFKDTLTLTIASDL
jgi:hypothetical protein